MIRPLLSLERLSFDEKGGQICYQYGRKAKEVERMDYLKFIPRTTPHIPDKGQSRSDITAYTPMLTGGRSKRQTCSFSLFG